MVAERFGIFLVKPDGQNPAVRYCFARRTQPGIGDGDYRSHDACQTGLADARPCSFPKQIRRDRLGSDSHR